MASGADAIYGACGSWGEAHDYCLYKRFGRSRRADFACETECRERHRVRFARGVGDGDSWHGCGIRWELTGQRLTAKDAKESRRSARLVTPATARLRRRSVGCVESLPAQRA